MCHEHAFLAFKRCAWRIESALREFKCAQARAGRGAGDVTQRHAAHGFIQSEGAGHRKAERVAHLHGIETGQDGTRSRRANAANQAGRHVTSVVAGGHQNRGAGQFDFESQSQRGQKLLATLSARLGARQQRRQHGRHRVHERGDVGVVKIQHFE